MFEQQKAKNRMTNRKFYRSSILEFLELKSCIVFLIDRIDSVTYYQCALYMCNIRIVYTRKHTISSYYNKNSN